MTGYDYGARMYDPTLARFHTLDPLLEKNSFQSPYVYADNSPIVFVDILGMDAGSNARWEGMEKTKAKLDSYRNGGNGDIGFETLGNPNENEEESKKSDSEEPPKSDGGNAEVAGSGEDSSSEGDRNLVGKTFDFLSSNSYYFGTSISGIGIDYTGPGKYLNYAKVGVKYAGHLGTGVSVISNTKDVIQGEINLPRYGYRMTGTGLTVLAGASSGGLGLLAGCCVIGAEYTYDNFLVPLGQEIQYQFYMFEESLKPSNW